MPSQENVTDIGFLYAKQFPRPSEEIKRNYKARVEQVLKSNANKLPIHESDIIYLYAILESGVGLFDAGWGQEKKNGSRVQSQRESNFLISTPEQLDKYLNHGYTKFGLHHGYVDHIDVSEKVQEANEQINVEAQSANINPKDWTKTAQGQDFISSILSNLLKYDVIIAIDFDLDYSIENPYLAFEDVAAKFIFPTTSVSITRSGGAHYFYKASLSDIEQVGLKVNIGLSKYGKVDLRIRRLMWNPEIGQFKLKWSYVVAPGSVAFIKKDQKDQFDGIGDGRNLCPYHLATQPLSPNPSSPNFYVHKLTLPELSSLGSALYSESRTHILEPNIIKRSIFETRPVKQERAHSVPQITQQKALSPSPFPSLFSFGDGFHANEVEQDNSVLTDPIKLEKEVNYIIAEIKKYVINHDRIVEKNQIISPITNEKITVDQIDLEGIRNQLGHRLAMILFKKNYTLDAAIKILTTTYEIINLTTFSVQEHVINPIASFYKKPNKRPTDYPAGVISYTETHGNVNVKLKELLHNIRTIYSPNVQCTAVEAQSVLFERILEGEEDIKYVGYSEYPNSIHLGEELCKYDSDRMNLKSEDSVLFPDLKIIAGAAQKFDGRYPKDENTRTKSKQPKTIFRSLIDSDLDIYSIKGSCYENPEYVFYKGKNNICLPSPFGEDFIRPNEKRTLDVLKFKDECESNPTLTLPLVNEISDEIIEFQDYDLNDIASIRNYILLSMRMYPESYAVFDLVISLFRDLAGPRVQDQERFLDIVARLIHKRTSYFNDIVVIKGSQGCGKSFAVELLGYLSIGSEVKSRRLNEIKSGQKDYSSEEDKKTHMIVYEESVGTLITSNLEELKDRATRKSRRIEKKNEHPYFIPMPSNQILLTNNLTGLKLHNYDERRLIIFEAIDQFMKVSKHSTVEKTTELLPKGGKNITLASYICRHIGSHNHQAVLLLCLYFHTRTLVPKFSERVSKHHKTLPLKKILLNCGLISPNSEERKILIQEIVEAERENFFSLSNTFEYMLNNVVESFGQMTVASPKVKTGSKKFNFYLSMDKPTPLHTNEIFNVYAMSVLRKYNQLKENDPIRLGSFSCSVPEDFHTNIARNGNDHVRFVELLARTGIFSQQEDDGFDAAFNEAVEMNTTQEDEILRQKEIQKIIFLYDNSLFKKHSHTSHDKEMFDSLSCNSINYFPSQNGFKFSDIKSTRYFGIYSAERARITKGVITGQLKVLSKPIEASKSFQHQIVMHAPLIISAFRLFYYEMTNKYDLDISMSEIFRYVLKYYPFYIRRKDLIAVYIEIAYQMYTHPREYLNILGLVNKTGKNNLWPRYWTTFLTEKDIGNRYNFYLAKNMLSKTKFNTTLKALSEFINTHDSINIDANDFSNEEYDTNHIATQKFEHREYMNEIDQIEKLNYGDTLYDGDFKKYLEYLMYPPIH